MKKAKTDPLLPEYIREDFGAYSDAIRHLIPIDSATPYWSVVTLDKSL